MFFMRSNQSGVVFITVTVVIMILMVLTVSIMSLNLSQTMISEDEIRRVQAEMLAYGGLAYMIAEQENPAPVNNFTITETLGGHDFSINPNLDAATGDLSISVAY